MTKAEIKQTADYLKDLEEGLVELHRIIKLLMDETFKARGTDEKLVLALIEKEARECLSCIENRLSIRN